MKGYEIANYLIKMASIITIKKLIMMRKIKHISELPAWFDLKKYEFAKNIKSLGWYEQLYARTVINAHADDAIKCPCFSHPNHFPSLTKAAKAIQENPNVEIHNEKRLSNFLPFNPVLTRLKAKEPHHMQPIYSLTLRDYVVESQNVDKEKLEYAFNWLKNSNDRVPDSELPSWMNEKLIKTGSEIRREYSDVVSIYLGFPDDFLIANFKQHLSHARKSGVTPYDKEIFNQTSFKYWIQLQVLPYADLTLWAKLTNAVIPCRVMANALYPIGEKGEETIRKTVKPLVKKLLHPDTWNLLGFQAGVEMQEEIFQEKLRQEKFPE